MLGVHCAISDHKMLHPAGDGGLTRNTGHGSCSCFALPEHAQQLHALQAGTGIPEEQGRVGRLGYLPLLGKRREGKGEA